jgi:hypothetical protein
VWRFILLYYQYGYRNNKVGTRNKEEGNKEEGRREEGKKGRREEGKKGRREEGIEDHFLLRCT